MKGSGEGQLHPRAQPCAQVPSACPKGCMTLGVTEPRDREEDGGRPGTRIWREMTLKSPLSHMGS